jgi:protein-disulfide isomerase/uncharacterized membrane protein
MSAPGSSPHRPGLVWPVAVALLGAAGVVVSTLSTLDHIGYRFSGGDANGFCAAIVDSGCASAHASDSSEILGIPISIPGTAFYASMAIAGLAMAWLRRRRDPQARDDGSLAWVPAAVFAFGIGSIGYSVWLASVLYRLGQFCPFCFMMYCVNAGLVVAGGAWAWPGLKRGREAVRGVVVPGVVLGGLTLLISAMTVPLYLGGLRSLPKPAPVAPKGEKVAPTRPNGLALPDRVPMRGRVNAPATIVEFSDLECPHCAVMHHTLSELYRRMGPDRLNVRFVNYPLDTACNCYAAVCLHKTACQAAKAGICAAREGLFWEYSDLLYRNRTSHQPDDLTAYAREVGISTDRFFACMSDPRTDRELLEDIDAAHAVGVKATPTVVINGVRFEGAIELDRLQEILEKTDVCSCDVQGEICPAHPGTATIGGSGSGGGACDADVDFVGEPSSACR